MTDVLVADTKESSDDRAVVAATLKARARSLAGLIAAEADRMLTPMVVEAIEEAGLFGLGQPGGYQPSVRDRVEIASTVGRADGSTAWLTALSGACAWQVSLFRERAQHDVWGNNPNARVCGVISPTSRAERLSDHRRVGFRFGQYTRPVGAAGIPDPQRRRRAGGSGSGPDPDD